MIDLRIWAWDMSRPLGEFPSLTTTVERLFDKSWQYAEVPMMYRMPITQYKLNELDKSQVSALVKTIRFVKANRPQDGMACVKFASREDQQTFAHMHFD